LKALQLPFEMSHLAFQYFGTFVECFEKVVMKDEMQIQLKKAIVKQRRLSWLNST
jgi:hypothetical protein